MADQVGDVAEWTPDDPDPETERRLPIVARVYSEIGTHAGHAAALRAVNRALVRAGLPELDTAELGADLEEIRQRAILDRRPPEEEWETVGEPVVPTPDPAVTAQTRAAIVATAVFKFSDWWARDGRHYPLPERPTPADLARAGRDRRLLLDDINATLFLDDLEPIGEAELLATMRRLHRPMGGDGPPDSGRPPTPPPVELVTRSAPARDGSGRFTRAGSRSVGSLSISRTSREGR